MSKAFFAEACAWAEETPDIRALVLVGSWARGENRPDSDIDLMVLTEKQMDYVRNHGFARRFGEVKSAENEDWSACQSVRVYYADGTEVEFGFVRPSWLAIPLDPGTAGVLRDGYRFLVDKEGYEKTIKL
ncbi:MAG: nucleotidyltransferase domain-containing protein [Oscillospiraceae bacterium]|nr:nucleotidyltransferase domain-containing protein [Oscillospiraceae bacterium]